MPSSDKPESHNSTVIDIGKGVSFENLALLVLPESATTSCPCVYLGA